MLFAGMDTSVSSEYADLWVANQYLYCGAGSYKASVLENACTAVHTYLHTSHTRHTHTQCASGYWAPAGSASPCQPCQAGSV